MTLKNLNISKEWTLFLDRDGVINYRHVGDYVKNPEDFKFIKGVPEAIKIFSELFGRILIITNQQGIGKGLMTENQLTEIHRHMLDEIEKSGGKIQKVYHAPSLIKDKSFRRKPQIGMGLHAKKDFPEIAFKKSLMAGDSKSDMEFGKRLGMKTVLIGTDNKIARTYPRIVDYWFSTLIDMAQNLIV